MALCLACCSLGQTISVSSTAEGQFVVLLSETLNSLSKWIQIVTRPAIKEENQMLIGTHSKARISRDARCSKTARGTLQEEAHFNTSKLKGHGLHGVDFFSSINSVISWLNLFWSDLKANSNMIRITLSNSLIIPQVYQGNHERDGVWISNLN